MEDGHPQRSPSREDSEAPSPLTRRVFTGYIVASGVVGLVITCWKSLRLTDGTLVAWLTLPVLLGELYFMGLVLAGVKAWTGSRRWLRFAVLVMVPQLFRLRFESIGYSVVSGVGLYIGVELSPFDISIRSLAGAEMVFAGRPDKPDVAINLVAAIIVVGLWFASRWRPRVA